MYTLGSEAGLSSATQEVQGQLNYLLLLYTGVGTGIHMCREVRGQLCGVSSFLPPFLGSRFAQQAPLLSE